VKIEVYSKQDLPIAANALLEFLNDSTVIAFYGQMGAGKTTFIKAICKNLGVEDNVSSPTYSIVNEYSTVEGKIIYHFDFYRIKDENEALDMGFEDYLYSGNPCLIEWPEKVSSLLPKEMVKVNIIEEQGTRIITFEK
jgi:tRNA threonylcarbamoyladenosine biosynthesis protein TsaE